MSVSFEETSPSLAANLKLSILFWTSEQLRPSQFYNWLAFNQTQWTRGRARSVTFHWNMLKPAVKSSSTQLSIYSAMAYDLVWMWLLYYEIFNFMTLLSLFPKGCRILRWDDVQELYQKILNNNDIRLIHVSWFHGKARKTSWGEGSFQFLSSFTECRPFRIPFATGLIKVGMIFTFVHLDLLLPPLPHAYQASQESKTDKKTGKNKGKTKFNIKIP